MSNIVIMGVQIKTELEGKRNSTAGRALVLHVGDTGLIPGIPFGAPYANSNSWVQSQE